MFVIVRHGNTFETGDQPRRIGARTDLPLTGQGIEQARALGSHFADRGWQFSRVLVSPLERTRQTAGEILSRQADAPEQESAEFLREIDHGPDEDQPEEVVLARIGEDALKKWETGAVPPTGWRVDCEGRIAD
jgi:probable phosphoglycerate mutase